MNQYYKRSYPLTSSIQSLFLPFLTVTLFFSVLFSFSASSQTMQKTQKSVYTRIDANVGGYLESLPIDYNNTTQKYPLIIFLHGVGERGSGAAGLLEKVANVGIAKMLRVGTFPAYHTYGGKTYSFIVLSPQMASPSGWPNDIQAVIEFAKKKYRVDENRIYLTGLSLGGIMGWIYSASSVANGQKLAASLLVCPGASATAAQLKNISGSQLPIWVTNNSGDPYNPASQATALVNAINKTVPAPPRALLTIFTKTGHDAWSATYNPTFKQEGLNVYEWMLSKKRGSQTTPTTPVLTASAGANQVITLPINTTTLDASASKVTSGTITSYTWTKLSGPTTGLLSLLLNGLQAKLTGLVAGVYSYQLTVKDSNGNTATATVTVTVNPSTASTTPPTANAGAGVTITLPTNTATLDGSASRAATGNTIASYKWVKYSGPAAGTIASATSVKTAITGLVEGTYVFNLTVTDNRGQAKTGGTSVVVKPATTSTAPPTVNAGAGGTITLPTNTFSLDGSASKASTGNTIKTYLWAKSSGPAAGKISTASGAKTSVTGLVEGTYIFSLTVTDSRGQSKTGGVTVIVKPAPTSAPTADAGRGGTITLPTNTFVLDGSLSKAAPGNTLEAGQWTKYSGPTSGPITNATSRKATATGLTEGTYVFKLTVTDNHGATNTASATVVVKAASGSTAPPTAKVAQSLINVTLPSNAATLDGSASIAATGNKIASYKWKKYTGPEYDGIKTPTSAKITVTGLVAGSYGFMLTVTDNNGRTSTADVAVIVKATTNATPPTAKVAQSVITLTLPTNTVTLDGSLSKAATGNSIASYKWTKYTGPAYDGLKTPENAKITVTGLVAGSYGFMLTVTDNNGRTNSVDVAIIVKSSAAKRTAAEDSTSQSRTISPDLFNPQLGDGLDVTISPNPVISDMNIVVKGNVKGNTSLIIYTMDGKPVQQQSFLKDGFGSLNKSFNLSRYPAGIYIVQVIVDGKYKKSIRVVKR